MLVDRGVSKVYRADCGDVDALEAAIRESGAGRVWFTSHLAPGRLWASRSKEAAEGRAVVDAVRRCGEQVGHIVYNSVCDADTCPASVQHFHAKADVET